MVEITAVVDEGLGNSAHLLGLGDGRAAVVDPPRDVAPLMALAERRGWRISHALETHLHADFVSGTRELAARGATAVVARDAHVDWPHVALADGDELDLGGLVLRAVGTPGHTPEHLGYLLLDGARPTDLFSGGALLPGSVARTDLIAPDQTEVLARRLYRALRDRVLALPDDVAVHPTHGAGSFCSAGAGGERTTTIGRERATNPLLSVPDEDAFVARLRTRFGTFPPYFLRLREVNRRGPRVLGDLPLLPALDLAAFDTAIADGAELVDARAIDAFAAGHVPGALSIALRPVFASWLGWLVAMDRPLVFVLDAGQDRRELVRQALGIGYEGLVGEIDGGLDAWRDAGRPIATIPVTSMPHDAGAGIFDVRQAGEFAVSHVDGAVPLELGALATGPAGRIPPGALLLCGHGERAMTAASVAARRGIATTVYAGGPRDLARALGRPLLRA